MASIFLAELDADVIGLGADCTNPLFTSKKKADEQPRKVGRVALALEEDDEQDQPLGMAQRAKNPVTFGVMRPTKEDRATVSLSDCLACSGCVTSAETVLLSADAVAALEALCLEHSVVVSVSQASLASLTAAVGQGATPADTLAGIRRVLSAKGVLRVSSTARAWDLVLCEAAAEFTSRLLAEKQKEPMKAPTMAAWRDAVQDIRTGLEIPLEPPSLNSDGPLPLLCGECPGVVCFLEKNAPHGIAHLSSTRSVLAATAALEKRLKKDKVKFVAFAPCADKKLEAARRDLSLEGGDFDMDLVLTTREALKALGGIDNLRRHIFEEEEEEEEEEEDTHQKKQTASTTREVIPEVTVPLASNAGSGGYLEFIYRSVAARYGVDECPETLPYERIKNDDCHAVSLDVRVKGKRRRLRFAKAYGFRNVQKIANSIKRGDCAYDFVEIMACPSGGCVNGGGQLQELDDDDNAQKISRDRAKLWTKHVDDLLHHHKTTSRQPTDDLVNTDIMHDDQDQDHKPLPRVKPHLEPWLHTRFHNIPKLADTLNPGLAKW